METFQRVENALWGNRKTSGLGEESAVQEVDPLKSECGKLRKLSRDEKTTNPLTPCLRTMFQCFDDFLSISEHVLSTLGRDLVRVSLLVLFSEKGRQVPVSGGNSSG